MTALEFMASFRSVSVWRVGRSAGIAWALIRADEDGTEEQTFFVMERARRVRYLCNPTTEVHMRAMDNPESYWDSPLANDPEGGPG